MSTRNLEENFLGIVTNGDEDSEIEDIVSKKIIGVHVKYDYFSNITPKELAIYNGQDVYRIKRDEKNKAWYFEKNYTGIFRKKSDYNAIRKKLVNSLLRYKSKSLDLDDLSREIDSLWKDFSNPQ